MPRALPVVGIRWSVKSGRTPPTVVSTSSWPVPRTKDGAGLEDLVAFGAGVERGDDAPGPCPAVDSYPVDDVQNACQAIAPRLEEQLETVGAYLKIRVEIVVQHPPGYQQPWHFYSQAGVRWQPFQDYEGRAVR